MCFVLVLVLVFWDLHCCCGRQIWSAAEAGDETTAEKVAADAAGIKLPAKDSPRSPEGESRSRGRNANTMQSLVQKAAWKAYSQSQRSLKLPSKDEAKEDDEHLLSKSKSPREDSAWRELASSLMMEGLGLLERLCWLGQTSERRSLLGSAYKRRAWTGLGESRKADLQAAAQAYEEAHALELRANPTNPSPYARLNQLTLELAAGNGSKEERDRLIPAVSNLTDSYNNAAIISPFSPSFFDAACRSARQKNGPRPKGRPTLLMCGCGCRAWMPCVCVIYCTTACRRM